MPAHEILQVIVLSSNEISGEYGHTLKSLRCRTVKTDHILFEAIARNR